MEITTKQSKCDRKGTLEILNASFSFELQDITFYNMLRQTYSSFIHLNKTEIYSSIYLSGIPLMHRKQFHKMSKSKTKFTRNGIMHTSAEAIF